MSSFGGGYDDGKGKMLLNTPENVAAITWLREMVQKGYIPEVAFAGNFQEESAFMDGSAGSFPTGLFGYRYLNPLTSPTGKKFEKKNENDFLDAVAAGDAMLAPFPRRCGQEARLQQCGGCLVIPVGAKNIEGAHDFINWVMTKEQNVAWVLGPGGGLPTLKSVQAEPEFQTPVLERGGGGDRRQRLYPALPDDRELRRAAASRGERDLQAHQGGAHRRYRDGAAEGAGRVQRHDQVSTRS